VATLLAILRGDLPINQRMSGWTVADVPSDWQDIRRQWERYFTIRVATNALALVATAVAVLVSAYSLR